jgi:hypothetical protein
MKRYRIVSGQTLYPDLASGSAGKAVAEATKGWYLYRGSIFVAYRPDFYGDDGILDTFRNFMREYGTAPISK